MPQLGTVMVLTRNESAVHEKVGRFDKVSIFQSMGLVLNRDVDLLIFFSRWHFGFAVTETSHGAPRNRLQLFHRAGLAVHKTSLREARDADAYEAMVAKHLPAAQPPTKAV